MKHRRKKTLIALLFLSMGTIHSAADEVEALKLEYEVFQEERKKDFESQRASLYDKYAAAIRRRQVSFQNQGNLEQVIQAKSEADLAEEKRTHGEAEFPGSKELRETLLASLAKIDEAEVTETEKLRQRYIHLAKTLQVKLTKANLLEEAIKTRDFAEALTKESQKVTSTAERPTSLPAMITPSAKGTEKLVLVLEEHGQSLLNSRKPITGDHALLPGRYRSFSSVTLGDRNAADKDERAASLKVPSGSEVADGHIYADMGALALEESYFTEVRFGQNLHSSFTASSCIFSECTFAKEGGWGAALSSRWTFENCVISASFFSSWRKRQVGVQIRNTTFEDVVFESYEFHEDAGKEATDDWFIFERCLFRNCTIPESVLIGTEDCVFENCIIVPEEIKIFSDIRVTLFEKNSTLEIPDTQEHITYTLKSADQMANKRVGSNLDYSLRAKKAIPTP